MLRPLRVLGRACRSRRPPAAVYNLGLRHGAARAQQGDSPMAEQFIFTMLGLNKFYGQKQVLK
ncbi:MAG TPA: hypothetical protein PKL54_10945, partial [Candidatus Hydrogenedentes bacterium]|nr:hypothetical protein [Candidatus Hydrogenedentota bacterium]